MNVVDRIKETAKRQSLTLLTVSARSGLGEKTIYQWNKHSPKLATLQKVADVLNVSVDYLLGNTDDMHSNTRNAGQSTEIDLDDALHDKGVVMRFNGKELSTKAKKGILNIINLVDGDEE